MTTYTPDEFIEAFRKLGSGPEIDRVCAAYEKAKARGVVRMSSGTWASDRPVDVYERAKHTAEFLENMKYSIRMFGNWDGKFWWRFNKVIGFFWWKFIVPVWKRWDKWREPKNTWGDTKLTEAIDVIDRATPRQHEEG